MKNLIQRLLGIKSEVPNLHGIFGNSLFGKNMEPIFQTRLNAGDARSFFQSMGVDMKVIGFPGIERSETEEYWIDFDNIRVTPIKVKDVVQNVITGDYTATAKAGSKYGGIWHPTHPEKYHFGILNNTLTLIRKK